MSMLGRTARAFVRHQNECLDVELLPVPLGGLPKELTGVRVAVVSDIHMHGVKPYHWSIAEAVASARPDVILIAGDTTDDGTPDTRALAPFFAALSDAAPTVAILGNNDCSMGRTDAVRAMYREARVTLLENETRTLMLHGKPLRITGLTDPEAERVGVARPRPEGEHVPLSRVLPPSTGERSKERLPSILLIHKPHLVKDYLDLRPSLIVAGHAHGGQFRLPIVGAVFGPGQGFFPKLTSGLYPMGDTTLLVSRGLGNHAFPLRIGNRPHIPVAVLEGTK